MRLQPVLAPDPLNAAAREPDPRRHAAQAPMSGVRRFLVQRHVHHLLDLLRRQRLASRRAGRVLQQPVDPLGHVAPGQRRTVSRLLPTAAAIPIACNPFAANSTIRARQTIFCGVLRSRTIAPADRDQLR